MHHTLTLKTYWRLIILSCMGLMSPAIVRAGDEADICWPPPYRQGGWTAQHVGAHNSDWFPRRLPPLRATNELPLVSFALRATNSPAVCAGGGSLVIHDGREYFIVTTSKLHYPNLHVLDMTDGSIYWQAAPPTNAPYGQSAPGPDSCASTICPLIDTYGYLYLADCHYVYCYRIEAMPDASGFQPWVWRVPMPNLKQYHADDGLWYPATDPAAPDTKGYPFMSFVFSPEVEGVYYVGGFTVQGETFMFNAADGSLAASAWLETNMIGIIEGSKPCNPYDFAATNNPMVMETNNPIMFGIWATGITNTTDPDLKYFMNPCQLKSYMEAGTFGTGAMIANNPCVMRNPTNPAACSLFIVGASSEYLARWDLDTNSADAFVYRVDFDPAPTNPSDRLVVQNYVITNTVLGKPQFKFRGRMVDGLSSATSPDLSANEKWLFCGDKAGQFYCFDTETGRINWQFETGEALGSPTTFQHINDEGQFLLLSMSDYDPWVFLIDAESGLIVSNQAYGSFARRLDLGNHLRDHYWRTNEVYQQIYTNTEGRFTRNAIGSSIITGCSNLVEMIYTVGWKYPIAFPPGLADMATIPTHQQVVFLHTASLWSATNVADMIAASYMDTNGTSEAGLFPAPGGSSQAMMFYISQSACMAQFMDVNSAEGRFDTEALRYLYMPEAMRDLYVKPYGGLGIFRLPFHPEIIAHDFSVSAGGDLLVQVQTTPNDAPFSLLASESLSDPAWQPLSATQAWISSGMTWTTTCPVSAHFRAVMLEP